jgi:hypothetical protein
MKPGFSRLSTWLVPPLAIAGLQVLIFWLDAAGQLPNPMAIHWGVTMQPDGFVSVSEFALTSLVIQLLIWIPSVAVAVLVKAKARIKKLLFLVIGIVFWLVTGLITLSLLIQVGVSDAANSRFPFSVFAFLILFIAASLVYLLAMPEIVVGEQVVVKLRGFAVMSFTPDEIVSSSVGTISAREFGGWGIRLTTRKIGFVPSTGPAVKLNLQDGTEVSIRSKDPRAVVELIEDLIS